MGVKNLRFLLFPFAVIYGAVMRARNFLFDKSFFTSRSSTLPSIGVGNLSTGGTGKSVVVDYLIQHFKEQYAVAVLSRGYGRKTRGLLLADERSTALTLGDEPFQFYKKHPEIKVLVAEKRRVGMNFLEQQKNPPRLVLLDDVMQHRWVLPRVLILTTAYDALYSNDQIVPWGNLRESKAGARRATLILVTKCPPNLSIDAQKKIQKQLKLGVHQLLFFTHIAYAHHLTNTLKKVPLMEWKKSSFVLVTGIAQPKPLLQHLESLGLQFKHLEFPDHHNFTMREIERIKQESGTAPIVTTEKDFGRLIPYFDPDKIFYLPIELAFSSKSEEQQFLDFVEEKVNKDL